MFTRAKPLPDIPKKPEEYAKEPEKEHSIHDLSVSELKDFYEHVGKVLEERTTAARQTFRQDVIEKLALLGMSIDDFKPQPEKKERKKREVRAKYRDPVTGEEWSGRGKTAPLWMQNYLAEGRQQDEFLIDGAPAEPAALS